MNTEINIDPTIASARPYSGKRIFDLSVLIVALPLWLTAMCAVALLVRLKLGRPVLFRQWRPGRDGRPFKLIKFRTMTDARARDGALLHDEHRLTAFGRTLRASSLDELPEIINILRGEMSFVGPRPLLMRYLPLYSPLHCGRHLVLPGLTGLAQVSGRNTVSWSARFDLDVDYVRRNSVLLDLRILMQTIAIVFRREGISGGGEVTMSGFTGYASPPEAEPHAVRQSPDPAAPA